MQFIKYVSPVKLLMYLFLDRIVIKKNPRTVYKFAFYSGQFYQPCNYDESLK